MRTIVWNSILWNIPTKMCFSEIDVWVSFNRCFFRYAQLITSADFSALYKLNETTDVCDVRKFHRFQILHMVRNFRFITWNILQVWALICQTLSAVNASPSSLLCIPSPPSSHIPTVT